jgi:hypothetical protein
MRVFENGSNIFRTYNKQKRLKPDPKKIQVIKKSPTSQSTKNINQFLGLARCYRFILDFSKIVQSFAKLLEKKCEI